MMIKALAHVCFVVKDLEQAIQFYQGVLGLRHAFDFVNDEGKRMGCYLWLNDRTFLELFQGDYIADTPRRSYQHICLEVDCIETAVARIREAGVAVSEPKKEIDHSWQAWLDDPDGNSIELHAYTAESFQTKALSVILS